jgi:hypothetical protein
VKGWAGGNKECMKMFSEESSQKMTTWKNEEMGGNIKMDLRGSGVHGTG